MGVRFDPRPFPIAPEAAASPRAGRPRLLSVGHLLFSPPRAGNEYRLDRLLAHLGTRWDLSVVICTRTTPTEAQFRALAARAPRVVVCEHGGVLWHSAGEDASALEALRGVAPPTIGNRLLRRLFGGRIAMLQRGYCPDILVALLRHLDAAWQPQVLLAEYVFMTRAFPLLRPSLAKVVDTLDVFSEKAAKVEAHGVSDGLALTAAGEASLLARADAVLAIHAEDAVALARIAPGPAVLSAGVDVAAPTAPAAPDDPGARLLMVGADNQMNVAGLRDFLRHAWPTVRAAVPGAELRVVGSVGATLATVPEGVRVAGRVEDLGAEYAAARLAINPAFAGTGLKIKSVEAVGHGCPLVAFPAGADGMDGAMRRLVQVAQDWDAFAARVVDLLRGTIPTPDAVRRAALAEALSAPRVYAPFAAALEALASRPPRRPAPAVMARGRRLLCLLARHGPADYAEAPAALLALIRRRLPDVRCELLIADNALPTGHESREPGWRVIGASNAAWEFSAWDAAIAQLGDAIEEHDAVALVTSAFQALDPAHLGALGPAALSLASGGGAAIGHLDHFNEPVWVEGHALQAWLRSSFVLVAPQLLQRLGSLVSFGDRAAFFSGDATAPWKADAPISDAYRRFVTGWLTGTGTGQGVAWHSRAPLTAATLPRFEAKALAILNEQMLTQRLRLHGAAPADLTWMAARPPVMGAPLPDWRAQVAARGRGILARRWGG